MSLKIRKRIIIEHKILFITLILCVCNALATRNSIISMSLALLEVGICIYFSICNSVENYILSFLLFTGCSIESAALALGRTDQLLYSFVNLPILSSWHLYIMLGIALIRCSKHFKSVMKGKGQINNLAKSFIAIFLLQAVIGLITFAFNDNGVSQIKGMVKYYVRDLQYMYITASCIYIIVCCIKNKHSIEKLHLFLSDFLLAVVISAVVLICSGSFYYRQSGTTIQLTCTLALMITTSMMLLFYTEKNILFLIIGLLSIYIQKDYTLGIAGSWWLMVAVTVLLFVICTLPTKLSGKQIFKSLVIILLVIVTVIYSVQSNLLGNITSYQIGYKLEAFTRLFNFDLTRNGWYLALGESIQGRLEEIVNTAIEFIHKPWFLIFGKGAGGSGAGGRRKGTAV